MSPTEGGFGLTSCAHAPPAAINSSRPTQTSQTLLIREIFGQFGVETEHLHTQGLCLFGQQAAYPAVAHQPQGLTLYFTSFKQLFLPLFFFEGLVGAGQVARQHQHVSQHHFRNGVAIAARGIHHHHPGGAGSGEVDIVHPCSRSADHLQVPGGLKQLGSNPGGTADN